MIPISYNQKLKKTVDGVNYYFHPPVGEMEISLIYSQSDETKDIPQDYNKALKALEKEYKGKRRPKKDKWEELIKNKIISFISNEEAMHRHIAKIDILINMSLCNWTSTNKNVPKFPLKEPAKCLPIELKRILYEWYWEQFNLSQDELKN